MKPTAGNIGLIIAFITIITAFIVITILSLKNSKENSPTGATGSICENTYNVYDPILQNCVQCPTGASSIVNGTMIVSNTGCYCLPNREWNVSDASCNLVPCLANYYRDTDDSCKICPTGATSVPGDRFCTCPGLSKFRNGRCVTCIDGLLTGDGLTRCLCPTGKSYEPTLDRCIDCNGGTVYNGTCLCPQRQYYNINTNRCSPII